MLTLKRIYYKHYTWGMIYMPDHSIIHTLELPWIDNQIGVSCIPEGQYIVDRDKTGRHQWYRLRNEEVAPRSHIEIHPANKLAQLQGCIAPCLEIKGGSKTSNPIAVDSLKACKLLLNWFGDDSFVLRITS